MSGVATYRGDIDGLRAIAVGLVVLFHADVSRFAGGYVGVDAFFVLSGFLITGLLLRELHACGAISLRDFYARRARRLLPLALLVIISTLIATRLFLAPIDFESVGFDGITSTLYSANWRFASALTNYLHADATPSQFLHFWSLAVEEQFYIAWPLLLLGAAGSRGVITKMFPKLGLRTRVAIPLLAITITSIVWSIASS